MEIYETRPGNAVKHPWLLSLVVLALIVFGALLVLQGLAIALLPFLFGIPMEELLLLITGDSSHPNARKAFLFIQGLGGGLGFLMGGWIFIRYVDRASLGWQQQLGSVKFKNILLLLPLLYGFVMFNSLFIYWNMHVDFPEFMSGFEQWALAKEKEMMQITLYLTDFDGIGELILGILVIGVLAGIGEEYLFRGILQPKLQIYTGNAHAGIWIAAIIFSAIHFQFYGFLPRLMLGALFGYLYYYSGSLVYPIVAHILNNALTVVAVYLNKMDVMEFDIEGGAELKWYYVVLGLVIFFISFKAFISNISKGENEEVMAGWQKVFESDSPIRAEIVKGVLEEKGITAIVLNKKESVYQIHGSYQVMVSSNETIQAINIINNEIKF
jgi:membrane protease YdiL (CAAX protease family)